MNTTPMNINPVNASQAQPGGPRQQDAASPDTPFSQVLSSEIAQKRHSSNAKQDTDAQAGTAVAAPADRPAETGAEALLMVDGRAESSAEADLMVDVLAEAGAEAAVQARPEDASAPDRLAPAVDGVTPPPAAMLALPVNPDLPKPVPAVTVDVDTGKGTALAGAQPFQDSRKGASALTAQDAHAAAPGHAAEKADPALVARPDPKAAVTAALASAFSGQLAAARQADAIKTGELASDLMSNPAMRPAAYVPLELLQAPNEIASPKLSPAVGTPAWGQALGEKIVWMANASQQTATLTLNPPDMGPMQIVLNVSNEQATASFFSAQPEVRQALEAAFPRLREMMNEAGIQLGQATVSADTPRQDDPSNRQGQRIATPFPGADESVTGGLQTGQMPVRQSGRGLVDTFA